MSASNALRSATMAMTAITLVFCVAPVSAQPSGPGLRDFGWGPGTMMGPGMMGSGLMGRGMCDPRAAGLAEWRAANIERIVRPTEAQRPTLDELKSASAKAADLVATACPRDVPASPVARLDFMAKRLDVMLQALKIVQPAFEKFYAGLTPEQQARLQARGPRNWGWRRWHWPWSDDR
jgi:hypothetical protein